MTVKNFKFLAIDNSVDVEIDSVLYTLEKFTNKKDLAVSTYINDATANRGISYVDTDGKTRYFLIIPSMNDGSISLEEFTV